MSYQSKCTEETAMGLRRIAVFMLVVIIFGGAAALTPLPARAQDSPRTSAEGLPIVGGTPSGNQIIGSFELKGFISKDDKLRAFGELDTTLHTPEGLEVPHEDVEVTVPLKILTATCESLHLEIGPFPHLGEDQFPLQLHVDPGDNVLRRSSFCNIARAVIEDVPAAELAELLTNPEGTCDWWQEYIVCPLAFVACGATCILGPEVCVPCLAAVGLEACLPCFQ
jgi:hypothetical protein